MSNINTKHNLRDVFNTSPSPTALALSLALIYYTKLNGGCTLNRFQDVPTDGYMVGNGEVGMVFENMEQVNQLELAHWVDKFLKTTYNGYFGGWIDPTSGKVYFDSSDRFESLKLALYWAKRRKELAIYDIANKETINIK